MEKGASLPRIDGGMAKPDEDRGAIAFALNFSLVTFFVSCVYFSFN